MSTKNTGKFALAYRVLDESGNAVGVRARITDDIVLKRGQIVFFNNFEEEINGLVKNEYITSQEANERIQKRKELDAQYNQETAYSLRAGKLPEGEGLVGSAGASKL